MREFRPLEMPQHSPLRRTVISVFLCVGLIILSIAFIDCFVARFVHAHIHYRLVFFAMAAIANVPKPAASLYLAWAAFASWSGRQLKPTLRLLVLVSIATMIAILIKDELKFVFGRPWPEASPLPWIHNYPSYINSHVFGFFPLHGGASFESFPSGHTTAISAPMAVLWARVPRYRLLWGVVIVVVVAGLLGADFHFVSDTIAGFLLGTAVAAGVLALIG
jgi:membrane-associated phospholipid phosphatase